MPSKLKVPCNKICKCVVLYPPGNLQNFYNPEDRNEQNWLLITGEVFAICGSCSALGNWNPKTAVVLQADDADGMLWKTTVELTRGVAVQYRYFKGCFLGPKVRMLTSFLPFPLPSITENDISVDDGQFGIHNGVQTLDSGWLSCQTEIRLRLHYSEKPPVSISKKKFKKSRFRVKLTLEGLEEDDDDDNQDKTVTQKMSNTLEISLISDTEYKSRHSQPECGYGLQPDRWTEYSIQTMEPDNLELIFDFFELTVYSVYAVDYIIIKPISGYSCDMIASYAKYWKPRTTLDVGHRGAGNSTTTTKLAKVQENTVASLRNAASHVRVGVYENKLFVVICCCSDMLC
ncbi:Putative glycerophosphocholine phosphodiesterase GPCPD1 [Chelonia mydas]|uniref:Putative glycerophosphocholine phosphodiesterase GPCPD1 n=1 Tax=Chelonia mydas TaxID=8469 RepID=M7AQ10_CHEMY|nr:Putative glycerophosphocholine phosphodiesterase GPCPD1 [Chelonia mydas]